MKVNNCNTPNYHGYSVKFSPTLPELLACAASENYGIAGKGSLFIITQSRGEGYFATMRYDWHDGLYNVCWSSHDPNLIATSSGDGALQIWNTFDNTLPPIVLRGHEREVYGLDWSPRNSQDFIISSGADETVKMWDVNGGELFDSFERHSGIVYDAVWCPHMFGVFASVAADSKLLLWDSRCPGLLPQELMGHDGDVFTCDWNVLNPHVIISGGVDCDINVWDLRNPDLPVSTLRGHEVAVRRVKFSPFHRNVLASVSYDFSTRFWDLFVTEPSETYKHHSEFVSGLDFSLHYFDKLADCGWDSKVNIYEEIDFGFFP